jgi:hypothetical protein
MNTWFAFADKDRQDWTQRETVTTDGSGWWASGNAVSVTASGALVLDQNMTAAIGTHGNTVLEQGRSMLTLKILGGPGTGQTRMVPTLGDGTLA